MAFPCVASPKSRAARARLGGRAQKGRDTEKRRGWGRRNPQKSIRRFIGAWAESPLEGGAGRRARVHRDAGTGGLRAACRHRRRGHGALGAGGRGRTSRHRGRGVKKRVPRQQGIPCARRLRPRERQHEGAEAATGIGLQKRPAAGQRRDGRRRGGGKRYGRLPGGTGRNRSCGKGGHGVSVRGVAQESGRPGRGLEVECKKGGIGLPPGMMSRQRNARYSASGAWVRRSSS